MFFMFLIHMSNYITIRHYLYILYIYIYIYITKTFEIPTIFHNFPSQNYLNEKNKNSNFTIKPGKKFSPT